MMNRDKLYLIDLPQELKEKKCIINDIQEDILSKEWGAGVKIRKSRFITKKTLLENLYFFLHNC